MSGLYACGVSCFVLSIWGTIQLILMGVFYKIESPTLQEDVFPLKSSEYENKDDFVSQVRDNYAATARNCFIAGGIYGVFVLLSLVCICSARISNKNANNEEDDDAFCAPSPPPPPPVKRKLPKSQRMKKV